MELGEFFDRYYDDFCAPGLGSSDPSFPRDSVFALVLDVNR